jgi:signal-transduction protein with cAMP-binding, CBS, and nucleotidyltransferase domain
VLLTLHAGLFDKLPFFKNKHPQFLERVIPQLKLEFYAASEYVVWQNDMSTEMYFITEGMLEARVSIQVDLTRDARATGSLRH